LIHFGSSKSEDILCIKNKKPSYLPVLDNNRVIIEEPTKAILYIGQSSNIISFIRNINKYQKCNPNINIAKTKKNKEEWCEIWKGGVTDYEGIIML